MAIISGVAIENAPGFSFDGVHSSTYGVYLAKSPFLLLPELTNYFESIPGREGSLDYGSTFQQRAISLSCMVLATSEKDLRNKARKIAAWLDPTKGVRRLILDTEPDKFYQARVANRIDVEQVAAQGRFEIFFVAPDPYAYALDDEVFSYTGAGTYTFERDGTVVSYPQIEIRGTNTKGQGVIRVTLNGKGIGYTGSLSSSALLVIDSDSLTAYTESNGQRVSAINDIDSVDFPVTKPGENEVVIALTGVATITEVKIYCRTRWI